MQNLRMNQRRLPSLAALVAVWRYQKISVYAAGGYYYEGQHAHALQDELKGYRDSGFTMFKMKIGGASMAQDIQRIESALSIAGAGTNLAVDANGRFALDQAIEYGQAMEPTRCVGTRKRVIRLITTSTVSWPMFIKVLLPPVKTVFSARR